jgi:hypothetical protein
VAISEVRFEPVSTYQAGLQTTDVFRIDLFLTCCISVGLKLAKVQTAGPPEPESADDFPSRNYRAILVATHPRLRNTPTADTARAANFRHHVFQTIKPILTHDIAHKCSAQPFSEC